MDPLISNEEIYSIEELTTEEKRARYAEISGLNGNRGWLALVESLKDKQARVLRSAELRILDGTMNTNEATYVRGMIHGLRWAQKAPDNSQKAWERLNKKREDS